MNGIHKLPSGNIATTPINGGPFRSFRFEASSPRTPSWRGPASSRRGRTGHANAASAP